MDLPFYRNFDLPWTTGAGQEKRFQRLLGTTFLVALVLGVVWPFIPTPEPDPYEVEEIPDRIVQMLLEMLGEPIMTTTLRMPDADEPMSDGYEIQERLGNQLDVVIDGGPCGTEASTVVDLTGDAPVIVRQGKGELDTI